jgi:hypothetical protein
MEAVAAAVAAVTEKVVVVAVAIRSIRDNQNIVPNSLERT